MFVGRVVIFISNVKGKCALTPGGRHFVGVGRFECLRLGRLVE